MHGSIEQLPTLFVQYISCAVVRASHVRSMDLCVEFKLARTRDGNVDTYVRQLDPIRTIIRSNLEANMKWSSTET